MNGSSRATVTRSGLETTITAAVQQTSFECRDFLGVYVEHCADDALGTNWRVKGIKYGRAPRETCDAALDEIVRVLSRGYVVEAPRSAARGSPKFESPMPAPASVSPLSEARRRLAQGS